MSNRRQVQDRREFLQRGVQGLAGAGVGFVSLPSLGLAISDLNQPHKPEAKADAVIQVFLSGGLSHLDTFDPKPHAPVEVRGSFRTVKSKIDGEPFSELLPRLAAIGNKICVVRSMTHGEAAHERGRHSMLTGYQPSPAVAYPSMGSVVCHELGSRKSLPAYACVPSAADEFLGTGYLSSAYAAFSVGGDPGRRGFRVRDLSLPSGIDASRLERRRRLLADLNDNFDQRATADSLNAHGAFYDQAYELITSKKAQDAFRIDRVPQKQRQRYGTGIGQRLLLASRLVKAGVRWVTVLDGGYDNHRQLARALPPRARALDLGLATLIQDLAASGRLEKTLILVCSEFGRTPRINTDQGRDHWPRAFSVMLAGGGTKAGYVHGRTDPEGSRPEADAVKPADLSATMFQLLGIDPKKKILSPGDRPIDIVRDGRVISEILA